MPWREERPSLSTGEVALLLLRRRLGRRGSGAGHLFAPRASGPQRLDHRVQLIIPPSQRRVMRATEGTFLTSGDGFVQVYPPQSLEQNPVKSFFL